MKSLEQNISESWVLIELYRWQHGELPLCEINDKTLDYSQALVKMAEAIEKRDIRNFPSPYAVAEVLKWCSQNIKQ